MIRIFFILVLLSCLCQFVFGQDESPIDKLIIKQDLKNRKGVVDVNDSVVIPFKFNWIVALPPFNFAIEKDKLFALYDFQGNQLSEFKYRTISRFQEGVGIFNLPTGKAGYINEAGVEIISVFDWVSHFYHGKAAVKTDQVAYLINRSGERLSPKYYAHMLRHSKSDLYVVTNENNLKGIVDSSGQEVVEPIYDNIHVYPKYMSVKLKKKYGVINLEGEELFYSMPELHSFGKTVEEIKLNYDTINSCFNNKTISKQGAIQIAKEENYFNYENTILVRRYNGSCCWSIRSSSTHGNSEYVWRTWRHIWIDMNSGKVLNKEKGETPKRRKLD